MVRLMQAETSIMRAEAETTAQNTKESRGRLMQATTGSAAGFAPLILALMAV